MIGNSGRKIANVCDKHAKETIRNIATHFIVPAFNILLRKSGSKVPEDIPKEGQEAMSADAWHLAVLAVIDDRLQCGATTADTSVGELAQF